MPDLNALTADQVLRIPACEPERLFTGEPAAAKKEYRSLVQAWHPDHSGDERAPVVFAHIVALYRSAEEKLANGGWTVPGLLVLRHAAYPQRTFRIRHHRRHELELGHLYVGDTAASWVLAPADRDLFEAAREITRSFSYAVPALREQFERVLPSVLSAEETDRGLLFAVRKTPDQLLLRDLLAHMGGRLPAAHAAWVITRLLNLACYLEATGIMHGALHPDTLFVSPPHHSVAILGGWWYAARAGQPLRALPGATVAAVGDGLLADRTAAARIDLELVRATGRAVLGDPAGAALLTDPSVPRPLALWANQPAGASAVGDYEAWQQVLADSFGPRRFVELPVTATDVYA